MRSTEETLIITNLENSIASNENQKLSLENEIKNFSTNETTSREAGTVKSSKSKSPRSPNPRSPLIGKKQNAQQNEQFLTSNSTKKGKHSPEGVDVIKKAYVII